MIVKSKKVTDSEQVFTKVIAKIKEKIKIPINKVNKNDSGVVTELCKNNNDIALAKDTLTDELGDDYEIKIATLRKPRILVHNIVDTEFTKETMEEDINERNFSTIEDKAIVLYSKPNQEKNLNAIIEVTRDIYRTLNNNSRRIYIGSRS